MIRAEAADRGGELPFRVMDDVGIGRMRVVEPASLVALEAAQRLVGRALSHEAVHQLPQVSDRGSAAPDARSLRGPFENVDEPHGLAALDHGLVVTSDTTT